MTGPRWEIKALQEISEHIHKKHSKPEDERMDEVCMHVNDRTLYPDPDLVYDEEEMEVKYIDKEKIEVKYI
eukprot:SAG22_NODE_2909_length_2110_cov_3.407757_1_plen_71_part_00